MEVHEFSNQGDHLLHCTLYNRLSSRSPEVEWLATRGLDTFMMAK